MRIQTENIFQVIDLEATPSEVYKVFLNPNRHAEFTGKKAEIEPIEGSNFSFCNKTHWGQILKLVPNKQIVLALTNKRFPKNHFSIVSIKIQKNENGGTRIRLNHIGVPVSCDGWFTESWQTTYWTPLSRYFGQRVLN